MPKECRNLDPCPLDPGIDSGGKLDDIGDVSAADAGCGLEEVEAAVGVGFDELGVGDAGDETERLDDLLVDRRREMRASLDSLSSARVLKTPPWCMVCMGGLPYL